MSTVYNASCHGQHGTQRTLAANVSSETTARTVSERDAYGNFFSQGVQVKWREPSADDLSALRATQARWAHLTPVLAADLPRGLYVIWKG